MEVESHNNIGHGVVLKQVCSLSRVLQLLYQAYIYSASGDTVRLR